ncbi:MAG: AEC family transporter [Spirochaetales bacterium]|nr:AEC family transporter [Spirochaetales bacterium]
MDSFLITFEAVAMLLCIGLIGAWMVKRRLVEEKFFSLLTPLALEIALPALVFSNIINNFNPEVKQNWWELPLWWMFFTGIAFVLTMLCILLAGKSLKREFGVALFYQNGIFFPLAILGNMAGGSEYLVDLFFFVVFFTAFFFNTSFLFFKSKEKIDWKRILHPVFIATILAVVMKLTRTHTVIPSFVLTSLSTVGAMAIPLLMIILGGNMLVDFKRMGKLHLAEIIKFISCKNIIFPAVMLLIVYGIRPSYNIALLLILQSAVPPITAAPLIVERYGGDRSAANQFLFGSFLVSLVSIPAALFVLDYVYSL